MGRNRRTLYQLLLHDVGPGLRNLLRSDATRINHGGNLEIFLRFYQLTKHVEKNTEDFDFVFIYVTLLILFHHYS